MFSLRAARDKVASTLRPEGLLNVAAHLVAARADGGAERHEEVAWFRSGSDQSGNRGPRNPGGGSTPSRMHGGDAARDRIRDEQGKAIRGLDGEKLARRFRDAHIGLGRAAPGGSHNRTTMDLLQEEDFARGGESPAGALACRFSRAGDALPEPVDGVMDPTEES